MTPESSQELLDRCEQSGATAFQMRVEGCAQVYDRIRHLPSILTTITADELADFSVEGSSKIVTRLEACASNLGKPKGWGSWPSHHDHAAVQGALKAERRMLLDTLNAEGLANIFVRAAE